MERKSRKKPTAAPPAPPTTTSDSEASSVSASASLSALPTVSSSASLTATADATATTAAQRSSSPVVESRRASSPPPNAHTPGSHSTSSRSSPAPSANPSYVTLPGSPPPGAAAASADGSAEVPNNSAFPGVRLRASVDPVSLSGVPPVADAADPLVADKESSGIRARLNNTKTLLKRKKKGSRKASRKHSPVTTTQNAPMGTLRKPLQGGPVRLVSSAGRSSHRWAPTSIGPLHADFLSVLMECICNEMDFSENELRKEKGVHLVIGSKRVHVRSVSELSDEQLLKWYSQITSDVDVELRDNDDYGRRHLLSLARTAFEHLYLKPVLDLGAFSLDEVWEHRSESNAKKAALLEFKSIFNNSYGSGGGRSRFNYFTHSLGEIFVHQRRVSPALRTFRIPFPVVLLSMLLLKLRALETQGTFRINGDHTAVMALKRCLLVEDYAALLDEEVFYSSAVPASALKGMFEGLKPKLFPDYRDITDYCHNDWDKIRDVLYNRLPPSHLTLLTFLVHLLRLFAEYRHVSSMGVPQLLMCWTPCLVSQDFEDATDLKEYARLNELVQKCLLTIMEKHPNHLIGKCAINCIVLNTASGKSGVIMDFKYDLEKAQEHYLVRYTGNNGGGRTGEPEQEWLLDADDTIAWNSHSTVPFDQVQQFYKQFVLSKRDVWGTVVDLEVALRSEMFADEYVVPTHLLNFYASTTPSLDTLRDVASSVIHYTSHRGHIMNFLSALIEQEVGSKTEADALFGARSVAGVTIRRFFESVAPTFVREKVAPLLTQLNNSARSETLNASDVPPPEPSRPHLEETTEPASPTMESKMEDYEAQRQQATKLLASYILSLVETLTEGVEEMPVCVRHVLAMVREAVERAHGSQSAPGVLGGVLFSCFIIPTIRVPPSDIALDGTKLEPETEHALRTAATVMLASARNEKLEEKEMLPFNELVVELCGDRVDAFVLEVAQQYDVNDEDSLVRERTELSSVFGDEKDALDAFQKVLDALKKKREGLCEEDESMREFFQMVDEEEQSVAASAAAAEQAAK